jgi:hypothetical protein
LARSGEDVHGKTHRQAAGQIKSAQSCQEGNEPHGKNAGGKDIEVNKNRCNH